MSGNFTESKSITLTNKEFDKGYESKHGIKNGQNFYPPEDSLDKSLYDAKLEDPFGMKIEGPVKILAEEFIKQFENKEEIEKKKKVWLKDLYDEEEKLCAELNERYEIAFGKDASDEFKRRIMSIEDQNKEYFTVKENEQGLTKDDIHQLSQLPAKGENGWKKRLSKRPEDPEMKSPQPKRLHLLADLNKYDTEIPEDDSLKCEEKYKVSESESDSEGDLFGNLKSFVVYSDESDSDEIEYISTIVKKRKKMVKAAKKKQALNKPVLAKGFNFILACNNLKQKRVYAPHYDLFHFYCSDEE